MLTKYSKSPLLLMSVFLVQVQAQWCLSQYVSFSGDSILPSGKSLTQIVIGKGVYDSLYSVQLTNLDGTGSKVPPSGCVESGSFTLTLDPGDGIAQMDYWRKDHPVLSGRYQWYKVQYTLNSGTVVTFDATQLTPPLNPVMVSYSVSAGSGIYYIYQSGDSSGCSIDCVYFYERSSCFVTISLTAIAGQSQVVIIDATISKTFTAAITNCGTLEYQVTYSPTSPTPNLISLSTSTQMGIVFAQSNNLADANSYTVKVEARVVGQTSWLTSATATYTYEPCIVTSFSMIDLSNTFDFTYIITDPTFSWTIDASLITTQVPACGYPQTLVSVGQPIIVNVAQGVNDQISYSMFSIDRSEEGTFVITVTSTLDNYNFSPPRSAPTCQSYFTFTIKDLCTRSIISIVPPRFDNLIAFSGFDQQQTLIHPFNDTVSVSNTLPTESSDYCGEKNLKFQINGVDTEDISALNGYYIELSQVQTKYPVGEYQATVVAYLNDFDTITSLPIDFKLIILDNKVPSIANQVYIVGQSALVIPYDSFEVIPLGYYAGDSFINAYFFSGTTLPPTIDWSCGCLESVNDADWIELFESENKFIVNTIENAYAGVYSILLVKSFQDFTNIEPYAQFQLTVKPAAKFSTESESNLEKKPPFFKQELTVQNVTQCTSTGQNAVWSFTLPPFVDPSDTYVDVKVTFDETFFDYTNSNKTIRQKTVVQKPVNKTIFVTLKNGLNIKATYSLQVQFLCNSTKNFSFNFEQKAQLEGVKKQKKWPGLFISHIELNGLMHVKFYQKMKVPDHPELIQNETIILNGTTYPILDLQVLPGQLTNPRLVGFNWTFVQFTEWELQIQLSFEHLSYVSSRSAYPDSIKLTIYGFQFFADSLGNFMLPQTSTNQKVIPPLASQNEVEAMQSQAQLTSGVAGSAFLINTVIMVILSGPLQKIIGSLRQSQIIVHLMLIKVAYPASALVFFGGLMNLLTLQVYDFSGLYNKWFRLDPFSVGSNPLNSQFQLMGYNSLYIIQNFGTLCWTIFLPFIAVISAPLVVYICKREFSHLKEKSRRWMFYDFWISFFDETNLFLTVCVALNLQYNWNWSGYGDIWNSFISVLFGSLLVVFPFFVAIFYNRKENFDLIMTRNKEFLARFGSILRGVNFKREGKTVFIYIVASLLRKLWLAYILVCMNNRPVFGLFQVTAQTLIMMAISGLTNPMVSVTENRMQLLNESFMLAFTYHLYPLTDFMTDLEVRNYVASSLKIVMISNLAINSGLTLLQSLQDSYRKLKLWRMKRKQTIERSKSMNRKIQIYREQVKQQKANRKVRFETPLDQDEQQIEEQPKPQKDRKINIRAQRAQPVCENIQTDQQLDRVLQQFKHEQWPEVREVYIVPDQYSQRGKDKDGMDLRGDFTKNVDSYVASLGLTGAAQNLNSYLCSLSQSQLNTMQLLHERKQQNDIIRQKLQNAKQTGSLARDQNLISLKPKQTFIDTAANNILSRNVPIMNINFDQYTHSFLEMIYQDSAAPLIVLEQKYPNLQVETLSTMYSEWNHLKVELKKVMIGPLLLRFGVFREDKELQSIGLYENATAKQVQCALLAAVKKAEWELRDFPEQLRRDIKSGRFIHLLNEYAARRAQFYQDAAQGKIVKFRDYGFYDAGLFFKDRVVIYNNIVADQNIAGVSNQ